MKLPSQEITKTVAKKKKVTKPKCEVKVEPVVEKAPEVPLGKYELKAQMNDTTLYTYGDDMGVFASLPKQAKYTTKGIFTLTDKETGKSFEVAFPAFLTRKLLTNRITQVVQWKRMSHKVA